MWVRRPRAGQSSHTVWPGRWADREVVAMVVVVRYWSRALRA